jgi:hypothetical protein
LADFHDLCRVCPLLARNSILGGFSGQIGAHSGVARVYLASHHHLHKHKHHAFLSPSSSSFPFSSPTSAVYPSTVVIARPACESLASTWLRGGSAPPHCPRSLRQNPSPVPSTPLSPRPPRDSPHRGLSSARIPVAHNGNGSLAPVLPRALVLHRHETLRIDRTSALPANRPGRTIATSGRTSVPDPPTRNEGSAIQSV